MEYATLSGELRARREALGMTVEGLAREACVASRYIQALEEGKYRLFPAKVYAEGAVRRTAHVLGGQDGDLLLAALNREWANGSGQENTNIHRRGRSRQGGIRFFLTLRRLWAIVGGGLLAALIGFWGMRLFVFASGPVLTIESPADRSRISRPTVAVRGFTEKESSLTVNGREVTIDERGAFTDEIELQLGVNRLQFVSESRFGKVSEEVRYILVE